MKYLTIGPKHLANEAKTKFNCDYVISIQDDEDRHNHEVPTPPGVEKENHKHFFFDDLTEEVPIRRSSRGTEVIRGHLPDLEDVKGIIDFYHTIPDWSRVYIHCFAGVSRSTAMSLACLCSEGVKGDAEGNMQLVERFALSSGIWPNDLIVAIADKYLGRKGEMCKAVDDWKEAEKYLSKQGLAMDKYKAMIGARHAVENAGDWDELQKALKIDISPKTE